MPRLIIALGYHFDCNAYAGSLLVLRIAGEASCVYAHTK